MIPNQEDSTIKRALAVGASIVLVAVLFVVWQNSSSGGLLSHVWHDPERGPTTEALGVEDFMRSVEQYRQRTVAIQGVVSAVSPEKQLVGLIDIREFRDCKITTCSALTLPIHWAGAMPQVQETIQVTGTVQEKDGRLVFLAQEMEKQG